ncbi:MAG: hypothetical protein V2A79_01060 [Planctomycetota bacterium]
MANTAVAATQLVLNTAALYTPGTTGTAIDHANTHVITPAGRTGKLVIVACNTTNAEKIVTVVAGDNPPADAQGLGTTTITLAAGNVIPTLGYLVIESARFLQNDGTIQVTVAANMTGFLSAYQLPAGS